MIFRTEYRVGAYVRLSKDDERDGQSVSIENQTHLLTKYIEEQQGWTLHQVYTDDGWSGTNFQRPGFQCMLADAKEGIINLIIVKDLSRFGRNYIEIGQFTDYVFPSIGCRFVALNDNVDTIHNDNDIMAYKNLFNEMHSRDTSKKVKSIRKAGAERGQYMGAFAPYGYNKDPDDKHHLIIDPETSPIVRRMFEMRRQGVGLRAIAECFNEEQIPPPRRRQYDSVKKSSKMWSASVIQRMLQNEAYIGHIVQGKQGTVSFKSKKVIQKPKGEWIRVENTHEPLVDLETWEMVHALAKRGHNPKKSANGEYNIFAGLVYCKDCGFSMRLQHTKSKRKDGGETITSQYLCGTYSRAGKHMCSAHIIRDDLLHKIVLDDIRQNAMLVSLDENWVKREIIRRRAHDSESALALGKQELQRLVARLTELDALIRNLYEDRVKGIVPETVFQNLMQGYEQERLEKESSAEQLRQKIASEQSGIDNVDAWANLIKKYVHLETLDAAVLLELINRIEIGQAVKTGNLRKCEVSIEYRFVERVNLNLAELEADYERAV